MGSFTGTFYALIFALIFFFCGRALMATLRLLVCRFKQGCQSLIMRGIEWWIVKDLERGFFLCGSDRLKLLTMFAICISPLVKDDSTHTEKRIARLFLRHVLKDTEPKGLEELADFPDRFLALSDEELVPRLKELPSVLRQAFRTGDL